MKTLLTAAVAASALIAGAAQAADNAIVINQASQSITLSNGVTTTAGNSVGEQRGTGSTSLSADRPFAAPGTTGSNGSLKVTGDRSRYVIGSLYGGANLGLLDSFTSLSFNYRVDSNGSPNAYNTPIVSFAIIDRGGRSEFTFEGVYNGVSNAEGTGWQAVGSDAVYFTNVRSGRDAFLAANPGYTLAGNGYVLQNGSQVNLTFANIGQFFSDQAFVSGISIGAGGDFGNDFTGYVDNLRVGIGADTNIINFEVADAVPEPATWGMMLLGFGAVGMAARRRRSRFVAA